MESVFNLGLSLDELRGYIEKAKEKYYETKTKLSE